MNRPIAHAANALRSAAFRTAYSWNRRPTIHSRENYFWQRWRLNRSFYDSPEFTGSFSNLSLVVQLALLAHFVFSNRVSRHGIGAVLHRRKHSGQTCLECLRPRAIRQRRETFPERLHSPIGAG